MKTPRVSILLSVYNGALTINRCLDSLLAQTFRDFELIIVNDGSTDQTVAHITNYSDSRIKLINLEHVGLAKALNIGLEACKGQYIARMDADDWCANNRLELQANFLDSNPDVGVVSSLVKYAGDRTHNTGYALHVDWINRQLTHEEIQKKRFEDSPLANPSCMFRKSLVDQFGNYSEEPIPEDYEFWLRLLHHGVRMEKIKEVLLYWSDLPTRITRNSDNYSQSAFFEVKAKYLKHWIDQHLSNPSVYIFGSGRSVNNKAQALQAQGIEIHKYLTVKSSSRGKHLMHYEQLPMATEENLVLSLIGDRTGKQQVHEFLAKKGYQEGVNYFMLS